MPRSPLEIRPSTSHSTGGSSSSMIRSNEMSGSGLPGSMAIGAALGWPGWQRRHVGLEILSQDEYPAALVTRWELAPRDHGLGWRARSGRAAQLHHERYVPVVHRDRS